MPAGFRQLAAQRANGLWPVGTFTIARQQDDQAGCLGLISGLPEGQEGFISRLQRLLLCLGQANLQGLLNQFAGFREWRACRYAAGGVACLAVAGAFSGVAGLLGLRGVQGEDQGQGDQAFQVHGHLATSRSRWILGSLIADRAFVRWRPATNMALALYALPGRSSGGYNARLP